MAHMTDYTENAVLDSLLRGQAFPSISTLYVGLFTTAPGSDDGTGGTECSGVGYFRIPIPANTASWKDPATATQGTSNNLVNVTFNPANAPWGSIVAVGIWDAVSAGNLLLYNTISSTPVNQGDQVVFYPTTISISLD